MILSVNVEVQVVRGQEAQLSRTFWNRFEVDSVGTSQESFMTESKHRQELEVIILSSACGLLLIATTSS